MLKAEQIKEAFEDSLEGPDDRSAVNFAKMAEILNAVLAERKEEILLMSREDGEQLVTRASAYSKCLSLLLPAPESEQQA